MISTVFNSRCAISFNPFCTVEIFNGSVTGDCAQDHILICPRCRISTYFKGGCDFVDLVYNNRFFCDVPRKVSDTEVISTVFSSRYAISFNPFCTVEIFNGSVAGGCGQNHILIGPICSIACDFKGGCDFIDFVYSNRLFGHITRKVGDTEVISTVFNSRCAISFNPFCTVEIFNGSVTGCGGQHHILIGPLSRISTDFKGGCDLVDLIYRDRLFGHIARKVGDTEVISAVFNSRCAISFNPFCTVEIFNGSVTGGCGQDHILIGPLSRISTDFKGGGDLVDLVYCYRLFGNITRKVSNTEVISAVFNSRCAISFNPFCTVKVFNGSVTCGCGQDHILIGPLSRISCDFKGRRKFINVIYDELV